MFGLGVPELLLILVIGLVIFGPGKLSESGKALGKSIREFRAAASEKDEPKKVGDSRDENKAESGTDRKEGKIMPVHGGSSYCANYQ